MRLILIVQFVLWMLFNGLLEDSVKEIDNRYSGGNLYNLVEKVYSQSEDGAIRNRFYSSILKESQIENPVIVIEYSSSGETFSYNSRVIGYNKNRVLIRLDYSFYSNHEKIKVKKVKEVSLFNQEMTTIKTIEYDNEDKIPFPSEMIVLSYLDKSSKWQFRLSETPTSQVAKMLSLK